MFRKSPKSPSVPKPAPVYSGLREAILHLKPEEIGLSIQPGETRIWGLLMETGYPQAAASLVALADGTASLYLSNGGGVLGGGEHAPSAAAAKALVTAVEAYRVHFHPVREHPLPPVGQVCFYALSGAGLLSAQAAEDDLGNGRSELSGLFYAGQEVITQLRLLTATRQKGEKR